jgi:hypothetical protein
MKFPLSAISYGMIHAILHDSTHWRWVGLQRRRQDFALAAPIAPHCEAYLTVSRSSGGHNARRAEKYEILSTHLA